MKTLLPKGWQRPSGYSNGIIAEGKVIFLSGQIGWDQNQNFKNKDMADQFEQVLLNIISILDEANAKPSDITRMTWFITSKEEYKASLNKIGGIYRALMGKHYPTMSVVEVTGLMEDDAVIEIEATAVITRDKE